MDRSRLADMLAVVTIASLGLVTAFVTFGILNSSAEANVGYSVGGAFAGALLSWSILGAMYLRFQAASGELSRLRAAKEDLEKKLIRGAPRPRYFVAELDEKARIVLARPERWVPRGGILFDFEEADPTPDDATPARFNMSRTPIPAGTTSESFYADIRAGINPDFSREVSTEFIYLGGLETGVRSLKVISLDAAEIFLSEDLVTGKRTSTFAYLPWDAWNDGVRKIEEENAADNADKEGAETEKRPAQTKNDGAEGSNREQPPHLPEPEPPPINTTVPVDQPVGAPPDPISRSTHVLQTMRRARVICFHEALGTIFQLDFSDDSPTFEQTSEKFNQIIDSVRFLN